MRYRRGRRRIALPLFAGGLALCAIAIAWTVIGLQRSAPRLDASEITWPAVGAAAVEIGGATAASPGVDVPRPMASITKLVTAMVVLDTAPLTAGEQGPTFQMTEEDAALAAFEVSRDGKSVPVTVGQMLTERQLLEAMLVASSNNHAASLVQHVFGSEQSYLLAARRWLDAHGLTRVKIADSSGMDAGSEASARDVLAIAQTAASDPAISEITRMPSVLSPGGELFANTNDLLGTFGIDGLKTGFTDPAGYTIAFTTKVGSDGTPLLGVILGSPTRAQRTTDVTRLIASVRAIVGG